MQGDSESTLRWPYQEGMDLHSHRDLEPLESPLCYLLVLSLPMVGQTHHGVMEEPVRGPA